MKLEMGFFLFLFRIHIPVALLGIIWNILELMILYCLQNLKDLFNAHLLVCKTLTEFKVLAQG